jgi:cytochrome c oxidase subunit 2
MHFALTNAATMLVNAAAAAPAGPGKEATFWLPRQASTIAPGVDWMFMAITYVSYFFFVLVVALMVLFVIRYRQRGREVYARGPSHHTPLEVTWTIIPLIICVFIFFGGFKGYLEIATPPANSYQIDVIAKQWSWTFKYPNGAIADDLYVPAGKPVKLVMRSDDVLHSLYIPDFRVKKDVVPARYNVLWFQANEPTGKDAEGNDNFHILYCTEYCGKDHSRMNRKVIVLPEADFKLWEEKQARWLDDIPEDELYYKAGPILYARCSSCHSIDGAPGTGPSWGPYNGMPNLWERTVQGMTKFTDGTSLKDLVGPGKEYNTPEDYLTASILRPNDHVVAGYAPGMPTFQGQIDSKGMRALIDFIKKIDEFDAKGKWKKAPPAQ